MKLKADWIFQGASIVTALVTVFVGWKALLVSRRTMELTYDHNKRSVRPRLGFHTETTLEPDGIRLRISVQNSGIGPANVTRFEFAFNNGEYASHEPDHLKELLSKALQKDLPNHRLINAGVLTTDDALVANEEHCVIEITFSDTSLKPDELMLKLKACFRVRLEYASIYDENFSVYFE
jgi:hypothetical protein